MPTVIIGNNTGDDYTGVQDNRMDGSAPNDNNGAHLKGYTGVTTGLWVPRWLRCLQRWDLSNIPSGAKCDSAILSLYDTNWVNRTQDCTINIYKISDANGDWIEGTAIDAAQVGSPSWHHKVYDTVSWAGSDGLSTPTTDFINTSLASAIFTDGVSGYRDITFNAAGKAILGSWFGKSTNNGLLLYGTGTDGCWTEWESRQGTDGQRPYLSITYSVISGPFPLHFRV